MLRACHTVPRPARLAGPNTVPSNGRQHCCKCSNPGLCSLTRTRIHPHSHTPRETCRPGRPARIIPGLWSLSVCRSGCAARAPSWRLEHRLRQALVQCTVLYRLRRRGCAFLVRSADPSDASPGAVCARSLPYRRRYRYLPSGGQRTRGSSTRYVWSTTRRLIGYRTCKAAPHLPCNVYRQPSSRGQEGNRGSLDKATEKKNRCAFLWSTCHPRTSSSINPPAPPY